MPTPIPQSLSLSMKFRDKLDSSVREEFDNLILTLQRQIGGTGVSRHLDQSEIILTGSDLNTSGAAVGKITKAGQDRTRNVVISYVLHDLMFVSVYIDSITLTGATTKAIALQIPDGRRVKYGEYIEAATHMSDAGTRVNGIIIAGNGLYPTITAPNQIVFCRHDYGLLTAGAGFVIRGQIIIPLDPVPQTS